MATTGARLPRIRIDRPSGKDRHRWSMWKLDKTVQEIAAREHASVKSVQESIDRVEGFKLLPGSEMLLADISATSIEMLDDWKETVQGARKATMVRTMPNGRSRLVVDHPTRLAAAKEIRELASLTQAKGTGVQVNVQNNNGMAQRPGGGMDFESRLRMLRAKNAGQMPGAIVQAQLMAPKEEKTQAELLVEDMERAGLEIEDSDADELESEFETDSDDSEEEDSDEDGDDEGADEEEAASDKVSEAVVDTETDEEW